MKSECSPVMVYALWLNALVGINFGDRPRFYGRSSGRYFEPYGYLIQVPYKVVENIG